MNIVDPVFALARDNPAAPAVVAQGRILGFGALATAVRGYAARIRAAGLRAGSLVAIRVDDPLSDLACAIALAAQGVGACTFTEGSAAERRVCAILGIDTVLATGPVPAGFARAIAMPVWHADAGHGPDAPAADGQECGAGPGSDTRGAHVPDTVDADDLPWLVRSSSGTTGAPKIFLTTHREGALRRERYVDAVGIGRGDVFRSLAAQTFGAPRQRIFYALSQGAAVHLDPLAASASQLFEQVAAARITQLYCVPMHLEMLCERVRRAHPAGLAAPAFAGVAQIEASSSAVSARLRAEVRRLLCRTLTVSYAVSEVGHVSATSKDGAGAPQDGIGRPLRGVEVAIVDPQSMQPVARGATGLIAVRFPSRPAEVRYIDGDGRFVSCLRDGWFLPGDFGAWADDGSLVYRGRADDMMIFNGVNVFPGEIEAALAAHPAVESVAAFGLRSELNHDIPCAAVTLRAEVSERALDAYCRRELGLRRPRLILRLQALPRNAMGKVLRVELRRMARERLLASRGAARPLGDPVPGDPISGGKPPRSEQGGTPR